MKTRLVIIDISEKFEDTKAVIRSRKLTKDRQCNGQKKKDKKTNNDLYNITLKVVPYTTGR